MVNRHNLLKEFYYKGEQRNQTVARRVEESIKGWWWLCAYLQEKSQRANGNEWRENLMWGEKAPAKMLSLKTNGERLSCTRTNSSTATVLYC